jgi:hypothetical protein
LTICSKTIYSKLVTLINNPTNKSRTITFPKIKPHLLLYFIRGYFEGDGYVNKQGRLNCMTFTSASSFILKKIKTILNQKFNIICDLSEYACGGYYKLRLTQPQTIKVLRWMYSGKIFVKSEKYLHYQQGLLALNQPIRKKPRNFLGLNINLIQKLYNLGYSAKHISKYFQCSQMTILHRFEDLGIKPRDGNFYKKLNPLFKNRVRKCKICNQIKPIHAKDRCSNCYAKHKARWVGRGKNKKWQEAKWVKKVL